MTRKTAILSDGFSSLFYVGISSVVGLALASLSLNYLGAEKYGFWILVLSLSVVGMMCEQGFGLAITRMVSSDNLTKSQELYVTSFVPAFCVCLLFCCMVALVNPWFFEYSSQIIPDEPYLIYFLPGVALSIVLFVTGVIPTSILVGMKKLPAVNIIRSFSRIMQLIFASILFSLGFSLWSLLISFFLYHLLIFVLAFFLLAKQFNNKVNLTSLYQSSILSSLWSIGSKIIISRLIGLGIDPFFKFVLGGTLGLSFVTYYDLGFKLIALITQVPNVALKGRITEYKLLCETGVAEASYKAIKSVDRIIFLYLFSAFAFLFFGLEFFLKTWLGDGYDANIGMTINFLMPVFAFYIFAHSRELFLIAAGNAKVSLRAYIVNACCLQGFVILLTFLGDVPSYGWFLLSYLFASLSIWLGFRQYLFSMK